MRQDQNIIVKRVPRVCRQHFAEDLAASDDAVDAGSEVCLLKDKNSADYPASSQIFLAYPG